MTPGAAPTETSEDEDAAPLDLSWPDTCRERLTYVLVLPIVVPLWLTLPDTRKPSGQRLHRICTLTTL